MTDAVRCLDVAGIGVRTWSREGGWEKKSERVLRRLGKENELCATWAKAERQRDLCDTVLITLCFAFRTKVKIIAFSGLFQV
jgi:hypothetical protein